MSVEKEGEKKVPSGNICLVQEKHHKNHYEVVEAGPPNIQELSTYEPSSKLTDLPWEYKKINNERDINLFTIIWLWT